MFPLHLSGSTWWRFVFFFRFRLCLWPNNSALISARLDLSEVSVVHRPHARIMNKRLNCGLTLQCLLHWLPIPPLRSHLGRWCNETLPHSYPGIYGPRQTGGCTCTCTCNHWLTLSPKWSACKPEQLCVRSIMKFIYTAQSYMIH